MNTIILSIVMAVIVEALVEYGKTITAAFEGKDLKTAITQMCAITVAVLLCLSVDADMFASLGISFSHPAIGIVLTGIFASRGSNYVSDLMSRLQKSISGIGG